MTEFTQLKAKYLGHTKNPFHQFSSLMLATTDLPHAISVDAVKYVELLKDLRSSKDKSAPREMLIFRILSELQRKEEGNWREDYLKFLSDLRRSRYWIEESLSDYRKASEVENTIFSPQPLHFHDTVTARKIDEHAKLRTFKSSREKLTSILMQLDSRLSKRGRPTVFRQLLMKPALINALSEIQYEVTDNSYWHALRTTANVNYQNSLDDGFFGDVLYMQVNSFSRSNVREPRIGKNWPEELKAYVLSFSTRFEEKDVRFIMTSYVDNGPGILEHVRRFACKDTSATSSISGIIDGKLTTRDVHGAGEGLSHVLQAILDLRGLLILTSGNSRLVFCGLTEDKSEYYVSNSRGTMITVVVPV